MNAELIEKTEDEYEEYLTEIFGSITIGYLIFDAGKIVRELDPIVFRCGMSDLDEEWRCNECNRIYDNKEEAEDCCKKN